MKLAIMPILASEALIHENKKIQLQNVIPSNQRLWESQNSFLTEGNILSLDLLLSRSKACDDIITNVVHFICEKPE